MRLKRAILTVAAAAMVMGAVSGCAENQIPDLSDEEVQAIGEYVAFTMMKYDAGHRSRLMELSEIYDSTPPKAPSATEEPVEEQEPSGMAPVDDTPVVDASSGTVIGGENVYSMEEVMELPEGVTVKYLGRILCDSYPNESDVMAGSFTVDAGAGKKLLILRFSLSNEAGQERTVDLSSSGTRYRVTVNGEYARWALTTILLDDLSSLQCTLSAGGSEEAVLIIEVEESVAENISSISLGVKNDLKVYTIQLTE